MNNLQKSFEKLEGRIQTLEDAYATTKHDVEDLKERLNANETDKKTTAEKIQKVEDNIKSSLAALQKANDELRAKVKLSEDKNLYLEAYSRRENIKFENIPEEGTGKEDTEMVLRTFLEMELSFSNRKQSYHQCVSHPHSEHVEFRHLTDGEPMPTISTP